MSVTKAAANSAVNPSTTTFDIDPAHSSAGFKVRHMMVSNVKGDFRKLTGSVEYDSKNPAATKIHVTIDASSIHTGEAQRDDHLRSADFLDVATYPSITFQSKKVTPTGDETFKVIGDLTVHGVTREVTLDVEASPEVQDPWGGTRVGATATTKINRKDYGLTWNQALELGGVLVGDEVAISIDVELVKRVAQAS